MPECIHGLDLAACDVCSPASPPERRAVPRATRPQAARGTKATASRRLHAVISLDEFADALADGELLDPTYFHGPEEVAWAERRRAADALQQVVLVVDAAAVRGLDVLPMPAVELVAVANHIAQERVRGLLALTEHSPRVSVYPPWFQPTAS